jgi:hypothetical protein
MAVVMRKGTINRRASKTEPDVFEFGGYHFKPYRRFRKGEIEKHLEGDSRPRKTDAAYAMRNMSSDFGLGMSAYKWGKCEYSHAKFYAASGNSVADIFCCVENGELYVPRENELFRYTKAIFERERPQKPALAPAPVPRESCPDYIEEKDNPYPLCDNPDCPKKQECCLSAHMLGPYDEM